MKTISLAFIDLLVSLEAAPDDAIDPDFEVGLMEDVASLLSEMTKAERAEFVGLIAQRENEETNSVRRGLLKVMPEALGLEE